MDKKYVYTLPPYLEPQTDPEQNVLIDLNCSIDYSVLCRDRQGTADDREYQMRCLDFIKSHTEQMNIIAHYIAYLKQIKNADGYDMRRIQVLDSILDGKYGERAERYFKNDLFHAQQERILYYLIRRERANALCDEFRAVLVDLFPEGVSFYYNEHKKVLYVSFVAPGSKEQIETYEICKFLFADILMDIQIRWNTYPLIIGSLGCVIAAENEQRCGSFI